MHFKYEDMSRLKVIERMGNIYTFLNNKHKKGDEPAQTK